MSLSSETASVDLLRQVKEKLIEKVVEFEATRPLYVPSTAIKNKTQPSPLQKNPLCDNCACFFKGFNSLEEFEDPIGHGIISGEKKVSKEFYSANQDGGGLAMLKTAPNSEERPRESDYPPENEFKYLPTSSD